MSYLLSLWRNIFLSNRGIKGFYIPGGSGKSVKLIQYADDATCIATSQLEVIKFLYGFSHI